MSTSIQGVKHELPTAQDAKNHLVKHWAAVNEISSSRLVTTINRARDNRSSCLFNPRTRDRLVAAKAEHIGGGTGLSVSLCAQALLLFDGQFQG